jgi:hypothetical protein
MYLERGKERGKRVQSARKEMLYHTSLRIASKQFYICLKKNFSPKAHELLTKDFDDELANLTRLWPVCFGTGTTQSSVPRSN